jgi:hypothetical protein
MGMYIYQTRFRNAGPEEWMWDDTYLWYGGSSQIVHSWRGRCCTTLAHPQTWHRFSSLIWLPNCQYTVTIIQGFTYCKPEHTIQGETKLMRKLSIVSFRGQKRKNIKYCTAGVLWCLVFKIHFTVKWHRLWNDESMGRSVVTKGVPISAWHGILSNTHSHAAIDHCCSCLKSC